MKVNLKLPNAEMLKVFVFVLALSVVSILAFMHAIHIIAPKHPDVCTDHFDGDVIVVTYDGAPIDQQLTWLREHNVNFLLYNIDHSKYYILLSGRRIPLIPPVNYVPAFICVTDDNRVIGTAGTDVNIFLRFITHCRGVKP